MKVGWAYSSKIEILALDSGMILESKMLDYIYDDENKMIRESSSDVINGRACGSKLRTDHVYSP